MNYMCRKPIRSAGALALCLAFSLSPVKTAADVGRPQLLMKTTLGEITLELDDEKAPISTLNFIQYVESQFYDGTIFHRVMPDFMIQGGGFTKTIDKKTAGLRPPIKNEWKNGLKNVRGSISMARTAQPDSATAQFFINVVDNATLDQPRDGAAYAVFGKVVKGMDAVDKIRHTETQTHPKYPGGKVVPVVPVVIESVRLIGEYDLAALKKKVSEVDAAASAKEKAFLEANAKKDGIQTTESGLQYRILKIGNGNKPKAADRVTVHYRGKLINGTEFDSSYSRNKPETFNLSQVIPGWTEGLQWISEGGKAELFIPSKLGFGKRGVSNVIPPYSTLIFEVELLKIH